MTLRQQLRAILAEEDVDYQALVADIAARLNRSALPGALRVGDTMPGFVLPDTEGGLVASGELLTRGPLVICFFRGGWCPFCRATLVALEQARPDITAAGGTLVALSPDTAGYNTATKRALGLGYVVLSDVDCAVGLQFGTVFRVPDAYIEVLKDSGIDLVQRHGDDWHLLPMPATFIVSRSGEIRFAYVSGDITDRSEPTDIALLVRGLADQAAGDRRETRSGS
jgi:peroxiredoxin